MTGDERADIDIATLKARLRMLRVELVDTSAQSADSRQPIELDQTMVGRVSRMDALQGQAMAVETERRRGVEIARIDAALIRMAEGEYGACVTCGEEIVARRLELDPAAAVCVTCASGPG